MGVQYSDTPPAKRLWGRKDAVCELSTVEKLQLCVTKTETAFPDPAVFCKEYSSLKIH